MEKSGTPLKDVYIHTTTSPDQHCRETTTNEAIALGSYFTAVGRACRYELTLIQQFITLQDCLAWVAAWRVPHFPPREIFVSKARTNQGESVNYRVLGAFYVIWHLQLWHIAYDHKIDMNIMELPDDSSVDSSDF